MLAGARCTTPPRGAEAEAETGTDGITGSAAVAVPRGPTPEPGCPPADAAPGSDGPTNNWPSTPTWLNAPLSASARSAATIADGTIKAAVEAPRS